MNTTTTSNIWSNTWEVTSITAEPSKVSDNTLITVRVSPSLGNRKHGHVMQLVVHPQQVGAFIEGLIEATGKAT